MCDLLNGNYGCKEIRMNWFSILIVGGILFISGFVISLLSSQLQCSKIGLTTSLKEGGIFATLPTLVFGLATAFESIRNPFKNTLESFGISPEASSHMDCISVDYSCNREGGMCF